MEKKKKQLSVVIIVSVLICIVLPTIIVLLNIRTVVSKRVKENSEKDSAMAVSMLSDNIEEKIEKYKAVVITAAKDTRVTTLNVEEVSRVTDCLYEKNRGRRKIFREEIDILIYCKHKKRMVRYL